MSLASSYFSPRIFVEYCAWCPLDLCYDKLTMCLICAVLHLMCKQDGTSFNGLLWVLCIGFPCGLLHIWDSYFEVSQVIFCVK